MSEMRQRRCAKENFDIRCILWIRQRYRKLFVDQQLWLERTLFLSGLAYQLAVSRLHQMETETMKIHDPQGKEILILRLRKIEGQVHGVQQMLDDERDCKEIMQQIAAIRSAVQSFSRTFLQEYATACLLALDEEPTKNLAETRVKREKIIQDLIAFLDKAP